MKLMGISKLAGLARCARDALDGAIPALVADGQLNQTPLIAGQHTLHPTDVRVKLLPGLRILVIVDAAEIQE